MRKSTLEIEIDESWKRCEKLLDKEDVRGYMTERKKWSLLKQKQSSQNEPYTGRHGLKEHTVNNTNNK